MPELQEKQGTPYLTFRPRDVRVSYLVLIDTILAANYTTENGLFIPKEARLKILVDDD